MEQDTYKLLLVLYRFIALSEIDISNRKSVTAEDLINKESKYPQITVEEVEEILEFLSKNMFAYRATNKEGKVSYWFGVTPNGQVRRPPDPSQVV